MPKVKTLTEKLKQEIRDAPGKGETFENFLKLFQSKYPIGRPAFARYWNQGKEIIIKRNAAVEKAKTTREINKALHELETVDGQIQSLINQIKSIEEELKNGKTVEINWQGGEMNQDFRPLSASERKACIEMHAKLLGEIRKIKGMEPAKKTDINLKHDLTHLITTGAIIPITPEPENGFKPLE